MISHNAETGIASILSSKRSVFEPVYKTTPRTNLLPASLKEFHKALKINRNNPTTRQNIFLTIKALGRDPNSFGDRVQLGDGANNSADFVDAILEYEAALQIKDDSGVKAKIEAAERRALFWRETCR